MTIHFFRIGNPTTACGLKLVPYSDKPAEVTCKDCLRLLHPLFP